MEKPFIIGDLIEVDFNKNGIPYYSHGEITTKSTVISGTQVCKVISSSKYSFTFEYNDVHGGKSCWTCYQPICTEYISGQYRLVSSSIKKKVSPTVYFFEKDCSVEYFAAESASYDLPFEYWVQGKVKEVKEGAAAYWRRTQPSWPWNKSLEISINEATGIFSAYWKDIPDDKLSMK
jgi:hypothetical protein